jgi:hypothetical protein
MNRGQAVNREPAEVGLTRGSTNQAAAASQTDGV